MRLSTSLSRNILEATVGGLLYKFKLRKRRHTLFFEEILINYAKECGVQGHEEELKGLGQKWGCLIIKQLVPSSLKIFPPSIFLNTIMRRVWVNLGLMDDLILIEKDNYTILKIKNEGFSQGYEGNIFLVGFHAGFLSQLYNCKMEFVEASQEGEYWKYIYEPTKEPFIIESKEKDIYTKLNHLPSVEGFTIKDALRKNLFILKNNRLYFRGKVLNPLENTVFHLIGSSNLSLEEVAPISYSFFSEIIDADSSDEEKLILLKNLLQIMGWGIIKINIDEDKILLRIDYPPYGLQLEKDNWEFLIRTILGYLWTINKDFKVTEIEEKYKRLSVTYSKF